MADTLPIGQRVETHDGHRGTIRFYGAVPPTSTKVWYGIEWDDASRGKHDGTHEGEAYFTVSTPGSGSFVKAKSVASGKIALHTGVSFADAVRTRYEEALDHAPPEHSHDTVIAPGDDMYVISSGARTRAVPVEFVGTHKISSRLARLEDLDKIGLVRERVASVGDLSRLEGRLGNVRKLDLACNLFAALEPVLEIASALPSLTELSVSDNRFSSFLSSGEGTYALGSLRSLVANRTNMDMAMMAQVVDACGARELEEIHLMDAKLSSLPLWTPRQVPVFAGLRLLDLSHNALTFTALGPVLAHLPSLETLLLAHNKSLRVLGDETGDTGVCGLPTSLSTLSVAWTGIEDPGVLASLSNLPSLTSLRIQSTPLDAANLGSPSVSVRTLVLALLPAVQILNGGSPVRAKERDTAERTLVKACIGVRGVLVSPETNPGHGLILARLAELQVAHPDVDPENEEAGASDGSGKIVPPASMLPSSGSGRVALQLLGPDSVEGEGKTKKLKLSTPVAKLRTLMARVLKIPASTFADLHLVYSHPSAPGVTYELEDGYADLALYNVEDGGCVAAMVTVPAEQAFNLHTGRTTG